MSKPTHSRVVTEPLGGSPFSLAVQTRRLPAELQPSWPSTLDEWRAHAGRVRSGANSGWYQALGPAFRASGPAAQRLERSANGKGIVVTTGQQAALFGGPLYTLAKALTALELADTLEQQLGLPVAPVFWAATDDADFLEASVTYAADADGLLELRVVERPAASTPMALAPLRDVQPLLERLRKTCGSAAHAAYFELARGAFAEERTMGDAYVRLVRGLLEPLGIAVMDSSDPAYRDAARPLLTDALRQAPEIARASAERVAAIRKLGFEPQVEDDRGLSLVYVVENGVKRRVPVDEARKLAAGASTLALAPNVLLRPVVERGILPTAAYVGGPAELAYFVQANAVASVLGREQIVGVPRWSCSIVEPFAERALERLGARHDEVRDLAALERRLAMAALPENVASKWKRLQEQVRASLHELNRAVQEAKLLPPTVIEGLERSIAHRLSRTERRLLAAVKRREEGLRRDLNIVSAALFPLGQRQERMLNYVPMLARGGPRLIEDMSSAARAHAFSLVRAERAEPVAAG